MMTMSEEDLKRTTESKLRDVSVSRDELAEVAEYIGRITADLRRLTQMIERLCFKLSKDEFNQTDSERPLVNKVTEIKQ